MLPTGYYWKGATVYRKIGKQFGIRCKHCSNANTFENRLRARSVSRQGH